MLKTQTAAINYQADFNLFESVLRHGTLAMKVEHKQLLLLNVQGHPTGPPSVWTETNGTHKLALPAEHAQPVVPAVSYNHGPN